MKKKEPSQRTKVVIRHLPPSLSQIYLFSQFDHLFSHRYNWFYFRPGKSSRKHQRYSLVYIDFKSPGDVLEFAAFFHGHIFVNEKGAQFRATVEYAPSQRVPKPSPAKDGREGSIYTDPDYLEFLKLIAKPVENLPSSETQLERKEAEHSATKEMITTTPLMEFVRRKRAAKGSASAVEGSKRAGSASRNKHGSCAAKRGTQKKKDDLLGNTKKSNQKRKSAIPVATGRGDELATSSGKEISNVASDCGKKKSLLLKGKDRETCPVFGGLFQQHGSSPVSTALKQKQRFKTNEKLIRSILSDNEAHQTQTSASIQPHHKFQNLNSDGKFKNRQSLGSFCEKIEKNTRKKVRPNLGLQNHHHSDVAHDNKEKLTCALLQHSGFCSDFVKGSSRHLGHHAAPDRMKDHDSMIASEQKSSKRRGVSGNAVHKNQIWVQKSSAGS